MACRILVPQPGIKPTSPALGAWSLNFWTVKKSQELPLKKKKKKGKEYMNKRGREERKMSKAEVAVEVKLWDGSRETE